MKWRVASIASWIVGNMLFQLSLFTTTYLMLGVDVWMNELLTKKLWLFVVMQVVFLLVGFFVVARWGTLEGWVKASIGYVTGMISSFVLLGILVIVFHLELPMWVHYYVPYALSLLLMIICVVKLKPEQIERYFVYGWYGSLTILLYEAIGKFLPENISSYIQVLLLVPLFYLFFGKRNDEDIHEMEQEKNH